MMQWWRWLLVAISFVGIIFGANVMRYQYIREKIGGHPNDESLRTIRQALKATKKEKHDK